ncbi:MAG: AraC family transcriptional regulator [SAR324 cluster bacterium]|nr:AraC family transcriptional regulator [SAR324 cluster bacterium]
MLELDLCLRVFTFSQLILIATQAQISHFKNVNFLLVSLYCLATSAYLALSPLWHFGDRGWLILSCSLLSSMIALILFILSNRVFSCLFEPSVEKIVGGGYFLVSLVAHLDRAVPVVVNTMGLKIMMVFGSLLTLLIFLTIIKGWKADLVEARRRLRLVCALLLVFGLATWYTIALFGIGKNWGMGSVGSVSEMSLTALSAFLFSLTNWRGKDSILSPISFRPITTEKDQKLDDLIKLMEVEKIYREPGVTLAQMAKLLFISEPRLRQLINQKIGAVNFNDFVNSYRVKEAAVKLQEGQSKILDLAFEVGFSSLAPFNKAFKREFSKTPTQYRTQFTD